MRTVRCSSRLLVGGVCPGKGVSRGVTAWGGVCPGGRGCLPRGVCIPACTRADTHHVDRMTDRCKNITFPQHRLRTVITEPIPMTSIFYQQWKRMWTCGPRTYFAQMQPILMTASGPNPGTCLNVTRFNNLTDTRDGDVTVERFT